MSDYIKREDAISLLQHYIFERGLYCDTDADKHYTAELVDSLLTSTPAADVVEVVRCRDCKHWTKFPNLQQYGQCHHFDLFVEDTFYCADGERKLTSHAVSAGRRK